MGAPKQKWTAEEEEALRAGVDKHGAGKWRNIQKDPEFACWLAARSNIDLKDKWRNMNVSASGQGSREKSRSLKLKANPNTPSVNAMVSDKVPDALPAKVADCSKGLNDGKYPASRYTEMIFEAFSALPDPNGTEVGAIVRFIEEKHEVPPNFRKKLSSKLRQLAQQGKIEKVHNGYKVINSSLGTRTPTPKQTDPFHRSKLSANSALHTTNSMVEKTAISIASEIAEAEIKSQMAYKAMLEAERVQRLAEKTDAMLQLAKEFYEQCSRGKVVIMA
ncbi:single myb histone 4-like isoform X1 [Nymphaea colorata]|nr:single myb histone 4-like isoform X1 [Nymphaea colorata]